ncbi:MAG: PilZ domain-containing protein [Spirochaetales bacterium]|jgi:hypothetical protein|nr:PilZ domain-containing protein [Spirochaetales bacterium]
MKNRENRVPVAMTVTLGAGNFMFEGMVTNISRNGFMVADVPKRFDPEEGKVSALITCRQGTFKMNVKPTWVNSGGMEQDVGFEILGYEEEWTKLLNLLDPINRKTDSATDWSTDS